MAFSGSSYCLTALSVSSIWGCQRKMSSVVISGQLSEPVGAMGGAGSVWIQSAVFSLKFTQVGTAGPLAVLSGQSCTEGCRAVRSTVRSSELALSGDELGQSTWPASQLPPPEQGGPPTALCPTCVHAHKELIWLGCRVSSCALLPSPQSMAAVAVGPDWSKRRRRLWRRDGFSLPHLGRHHPMHRSPTCIMSSSCLVYQSKTRLSYPYTTLGAPLCFWQVIRAVGRARMGVQGRSCCSVQTDCGRYTLYSCHSCMHSERNWDTAWGGTEGASPPCAAGARWLWLLHQIRFLCSCTW